MKNNAVFTIVAKNYIGLAQIERDSVLRYSPDIDFHIFVADEFESPAPLDSYIHIARQTLDYSETEWMDMAFKYNLTEFCTAIKPACFQHLFRVGYQRVLFIDPDIYAFSSFADLFLRLEQYDMLLTPHIVGLHTLYKGQQPEWTFNTSGVFNLGFCGMADTPLIHHFLEWWRARLQDNAFTDRSMGNFTDQKWMNWAPALLGDKLCVMRDLGLNVAPWNFFEREIFQKDDALYVRFRDKENGEQSGPLVFVHYSGYSYPQLIKGEIDHQRLDFSEYADIAIINNAYREALVAQQEAFEANIHLAYSYATYDNGAAIDAFHRRLYHGLRLQGEEVGNPFATTQHSFYASLKRSGMLTGQNTDKLTPQNYKGMDKNIKRLNVFYKWLFRLMGYKRYPLFLKSMLAVHCRPENHTFLLKKE